MDVLVDLDSDLVGLGRADLDILQHERLSSLPRNGSLERESIKGSEGGEKTRDGGWLTFAGDDLSDKADGQGEGRRKVR